MKKFIPIIGTISSGKSTFLKSLLGINSLETGVSTTTKFVCIIQNSESTKFYHVIPKNQGILKFEKDGMEVIGEENVAKKIEEINKELSNKTISKNNFFYMLEIPIKYINNKKILDNYILILSPLPLVF
jgi:energy-coupling factor transporter ATP-binding protein EcfA2